MDRLWILLLREGRRRDQDKSCCRGGEGNRRQSCLVQSVPLCPTKHRNHLALPPYYFATLAHPRCSSQQSSCSSSSVLSPLRHFQVNLCINCLLAPCCLMNLLLFRCIFPLQTTETPVWGLLRTVGKVEGMPQGTYNAKKDTGRCIWSNHACPKGRLSVFKECECIFVRVCLCGAKEMTEGLSQHGMWYIVLSSVGNMVVHYSQEC